MKKSLVAHRWRELDTRAGSQGPEPQNSARADSLAAAPHRTGRQRAGHNDAFIPIQRGRVDGVAVGFFQLSSRLATPRERAAQEASRLTSLSLTVLPV